VQIVFLLKKDVVVVLKEHLGTLQENDLIDYEAGRRCYKITEKGKRLLQLQNKL
jgi:predicted transcriptional regulator